MKAKTYYQILNIPKGKRGYEYIPKKIVICPLENMPVQPVHIHMMDVRVPFGGYHRLERCPSCFVAIPLPKYIQRFLERPIKNRPKHKLAKEIPKGQLTLLANV